jgi:hypothetical protein
VLNVKKWWCKKFRQFTLVLELYIIQLNVVLSVVAILGATSLRHYIVKENNLINLIKKVKLMFTNIITQTFINCF